MTALTQKMTRDLFHMKGQALAICAVMACGVATLVMSLITRESLQQSQTIYYERYRFAQVFAQLKRAPNVLSERLREIPGVSRAQTRIVVDVTLDVPGLAEPATGRLISIPERRAPGLNDIHLRGGRYIEPGRRREVLVSEGFAEAHQFQPGDRVQAIINGKKEWLTIVGVALSPEYIYSIRPGDFLPDDLRFGVFWMGYEELAAAYDMTEAFNNVSLTLMPNASEPEVLLRLDRLIEPYGGLGSHGRDDHLSHRFLSDEIQQLRTMGIVIPGVFLGVSAFLLNVVLSRLIHTQREQIAALKAFGYSNGEVGLHYFQLVILLVVIGVTVGTGVGVWLGRSLTDMYTRFYRFPLFEFHFDLWVVVVGFLVSGGAALVGAWGAVRRAIRLPPAEALRPEPPADYRPTLIERWGMQRLLSQTARMVLRNLERHPFKALFSCLALALAAAILILGSFSKDALDYMMAFQFELAQRQDMTVTFVEPTSGKALYEIQHLPGVLHGEPFRSVPVRLRHQHHTRRTAIHGKPVDSRLNRLLDQDEQEVSIPPDGLVLSDKLAQLLRVKRGDMVRVEVLEGERPIRDVPVTALVYDYTGTAAYMSLPALNRLLREGPTISGAYLTVDANQAPKLYKTLKNTPRVAGVTIKLAAVRSFQETIAENLLAMRVFNVIFASIIALGVVYNNAIIALAERSRELATLRVIGFTRAEVSAILLGEIALLTGIAIPLGLAMGYGFAALLCLVLDTELYRIPLIVDRATFGFAAVVMVTATVLSAWIVRRKIDHLDLVAVLKTKE
ncbi:MAG: ABC transporter permease [Gemmataceae bacterium]